MFYRVDYILGLLFLGLLAGFAIGKRTEGLPTHRIAQLYYAVIAVAVVTRTGTVMGGLFLGGNWWNVAGAILGDIGNLLFGVLFGLAARRKDARQLLVDPSVLAALYLMVAFTFAIAAIGKIVGLQPMTDFFAQSGYSILFLKFIIGAEILGAIGLLIPWAVWPALIGLSIDMFGAIVTHVHNGDPLNDSTGAVGLLIKLVAVAVLLGLRPRKQRPPSSVRHSLATAAAVMAVCLLIAIGGSSVVRHRTAMTPASNLHSNK